MQRLHKYNRDHPMVLRVLVGLVLYTLLGFALWWFISPGTTTQKKDFAQLMAQIAGGAALLFGLYFTWRRMETSQLTFEIQQDQQVTERFTRAIEQLGKTDDNGKPQLEIRLGGIYALERIANDSPERDYATIMEVLTTYVRENSPRSHEQNMHTDPSSNEANKAATKNEEQKPAKVPADIQAIFTVLGRRGKAGEEADVTLNLSATYLRYAYLFEVDFQGAVFRYADLQYANLEDTNLRGADLQRADLQEANLQRANLQGANLQGANLQRADLQGANLIDANLQGALLRETSLQGTFLKGAWGLTQDQIEKALADEYTTLPEGIDRPKS